MYLTSMSLFSDWSKLCCIQWCSEDQQPIHGQSQHCGRFVIYMNSGLLNYLTNRFHFAVRLYSDNAQMTSKRGENKEVRYEPQASSVTDVLTTF